MTRRLPLGCADGDAAVEALPPDEDTRRPRPPDPILCTKRVAAARAGEQAEAPHRDEERGKSRHGHEGGQGIGPEGGSDERGGDPDEEAEAYVTTPVSKALPSVEVRVRRGSRGALQIGVHAVSVDGRQTRDRAQPT